MANKSKSDANGANGASERIDGKDSRKPGSDSGTGSVENANNGVGGTTNGVEENSASSADAPKKRRGRKPLPRDEFGNIIRDAASAANATDKGAKERLVVNDRAKVKNNIAGLHAMAAVLTKQPIWNLREEEAAALTGALCDVADYHHIDLIGTGGAFALYASLATTAYMVYIPRFSYLKQLKASDEAKPANPGEYTEQAERRSAGVKMDFSADTVQ